MLRTSTCSHAGSGFQADEDVAGEGERHQENEAGRHHRLGRFHFSAFQGHGRPRPHPGDLGGHARGPRGAVRRGGRAVGRARWRAASRRTRGRRVPLGDPRARPAPRRCRTSARTDRRSPTRSPRSRVRSERGKTSSSRPGMRVRLSLKRIQALDVDTWCEVTFGLPRASARRPIRYAELARVPGDRRGAAASAPCVRP